VNALRNKTSDLSNTASEPDSLIDLYKPVTMTRTASYGTSATKAGRKSYSQNGTAQKATPEEDESNWIHRDKLAQIESRELEEAGFRVTRRPSERFDGATKREEKRQRLASPARIGGEDEDAAQDYSMADDGMTTPPKSFIPKAASSRSGGSRIPIPKGVSVSGSHGDRDPSATGTRSRTGSEAWNYSADGSPQSQGSGDAGHEDEIILANSPPDTPPRSAVNTSQSSPQKSKSTKNGTTGRKAGAGAARGAVKTTPSRTASSNTGSSSVAGGTATDGSVSKRPGTSSGPRPSTSHRPEGEPPWLATMYAPDPRLPPEQQMLPTHAKRLAQEQWEKEGRTGTVYDREFRLLNSEPFPENSKRYSSAAASEAEAVTMPAAADDRAHRASAQSRATSGGARGSGMSDGIRTTTLQSPTYHKWSTSPPLGSPASLRPGTGGTLDHGGYRTMPPLAKPATPNGDAVAAGSRGDNQASPAPPPIRIKNFDDEDVGKQKGGCCQCVVM
jgi:hypothetical protein